MQREKDYFFTKIQLEEEIRKIKRKKAEILNLEIDEESENVLFIIQYNDKTKDMLTLPFSEIERFMRVKGGKIFHIKSIKKEDDFGVKITCYTIQHSIWESEHRLIILQLTIAMIELLNDHSNKESIRFSIEMKKKSNEYKSFLNRLSSQMRKKIKDNLDLLIPLVDLVEIIADQSNNTTVQDLLIEKKEDIKKIQQQLKN